MSEKLSRRLIEEKYRAVVERFDRLGVVDPLLPTEEPWRSREVFARKARKNGLFVCYFGADAPVRIRQPCDNRTA